MAKPTHFVIEYDSDEEIYDSAFSESMEAAVEAVDTLRAEAVEDGFVVHDVVIYELKEVEV